MKPTALTIIAAILTTISAPTGSDAAQKLSAAQGEGNAPLIASKAASVGANSADRQETENDRGVETKKGSGQRPGSRTGETGITVMTRGEVDPSTIGAGTYAYVAYKSDGIKGATWGLIKQIDSDGIVIESESTPSETRKIAIGHIDILAVSEDRLILETWQEARLAAEKITVMSRKDLDLSKLTTGSYAHVVYTRRGLNRTASGKVLEIDADGIVIKSGAEQPETWKIETTQIDTLAFAKTLQAVERWRRWTQSGIVRMSRWDLNPSILNEGLYVHVVYVSGGAKRKATGRIVDRYADRIVIQYWVGGKATWAQPEKLEIAYGDVETVFVARDRRDLQRARNYFEFASGRDAASGERIAAKLIFGTVFGAITAALVALSHYPDLYGDTPDPSVKEVIPPAILHAAATAWVVSKLDPRDRYKHTFAGSMLGCAAVSTVVLMNTPGGYAGIAKVWLGYISVTTIAATTASQISRKPPDIPGFSVGLAPRRNGSLSAVATYRF